MSDRYNNIATSKLRQRFARIALLPVVLLQLTIAVHQFDHVAEYVEGSCQVCVQLDRTDDAVAGESESAAIPAVFGTAAWLESDGIAHPLLASAYDSRAPPYI